MNIFVSTKMSFLPKTNLRFIIIVLLFISYSCEEKKTERIIEYNFYQEGEASWYGPGFHNRKTANGERFDMNKFTAAHRDLEFGTLVKVTNLKNKKQITVRINDRGPVSKKRIIDLSKAAAQKIDMIQSGISQVRLEIITFNKNYEK